MKKNKEDVSKAIRLTDDEAQAFIDQAPRVVDEMKSYLERKRTKGQLKCWKQDGQEGWKTTWRFMSEEPLPENMPYEVLLKAYRKLLNK